MAYRRRAETGNGLVRIAMKGMKVLIALNTAWNLANFRTGLIVALQREGYDVVAAAPIDEHAARVPCRFVDLPMDAGGTKILKDAALFFRFIRLLRQERPDVFLGYTVKPNVYGSFAAHLLGIPVINNVAGLGAVFIKGGWLARFVRGLYRLALSRSAHIFFQNPDDLALFIEQKLVDRSRTSLLPGSGVDTTRFVPPHTSSNNADGPFVFLLVARLLRDKGVVEYVEAARVLRAQHGANVECCVLGFADVQNPTAITRAELDTWVAEGVINYLGEADDVRPHLARAHCVVLPSYREGTPRSLLEAAAMAKPIVTTDAPGCREVVIDGVNGYLCRVQDANDLSEKMQRVIGLNADALHEMGGASRRIAVERFDERIVITHYLQRVAIAIANCSANRK